MFRVRSGAEVPGERCERARAPGKVCTQWAWHGSTDRSCHLHNAQSSLHAQKGTTAAYMPNRTAHRGEQYE